jgi:hypothetical protein
MFTPYPTSYHYRLLFCSGKKYGSVCVNDKTLVPTSFKLPILVGYRVQCVCVNERTLVPTSFKLPILVGCRVQCVCVNERTLVPRAGHFRYKYRYFDIRYLPDTEKSIEISDFKSIGISYIVLQKFTSDTLILYRIRGKVSD